MICTMPLWSPLRLLLACALAGFLVGQETLEVDPPEPGTIRLGDTARVAIRIEGKSANPREPQLPAVDGLAYRLSAPTRSSYTFYDGRALVERVGVQYVLELRPERAGTYVVPPFKIWTGTREQETPELRLEAKVDMVGAELGWLDVEVEPTRVYVHEPVRVQVSYGVLEGVRLVEDFYQRNRYLDIEVQASWLNDFPGGERIELPQPEGDRRLAVCNRTLIYAAFDGDHERDGQRWQRFTFERAFLPTRLGKIELPAPMLRFHVLRRQGRQDILGRTRGALSENYYVYGQPITLEVLPIPEAGRPDPYFGAVGRFRIDAALERDRVRVGDSIKLTLTVRGQGNLEFLRLPELDDLPGFHKLGAAEAQRDADKVVVTYDLTPLSADVERVPAIGWNYFDTTPGVEKFVEVETVPLALTVEALKDGEALLSLPDAAPKAVTPGVDDIFDLPTLAGPPATVAAPAPWQRWFLVLLPWLLVYVAFAVFRGRQRAAADVSGRRARGAQKQFEVALRGGGEPLDALAGYLGDRLDVPAAAVITPDLAQRLASSGLDEQVAHDVAAAIENGTAARYGGGAALTADEVRALVRRLEGVRFGARSWLPLWLPLLASAALAAGELRAQDGMGGVDGAGPAAGPGVAAAVAAYRAGDYKQADAGFAAAYEATGDRRLLRARGNCLFRMGELPLALWAFESARLGLPRDDELLANVRLLRARLDLPEPPVGFVAEVLSLLARLTPFERLLACSALMLLAAGSLVFGWRRIGWRWVGVVFFVPAVVLAIDGLWLAPARPVTAVALQRLELTAEPRTDLPAVATVRAGVEVELRGRSSGSFVMVEAGDRRGYVPRDLVAPIE